jgi:type I restriction enzyme S subunit
LQPGDVLFVEGHGNANEIGRSAVWSGQVDDCTHQNHLIRARFGPHVEPIFASRQLNSHGGRRRILRLAKTTSGLNTISTRQLKAVPLLVPPVALQKAFVGLEASTMATRYRLERGADEADNLFNSLVQRAFKGEL